MSEEELIERGLTQSRKLFPDAKAGQLYTVGANRWCEVLSEATGKRVDTIYLGPAAPTALFEEPAE